jgi:hypothetical protein
MNRSLRAICTLLLTAALVPAVCAAQVTGQAASAHQAVQPAAAPPASSSGASAPAGSNAANPGSSTDCEGGPCPGPTPHITIATPAPAPAPWPLQDRIKWLTVVLLVLIAYVGVWLAVSTLHKIERQTHYSELAAQAATEAAKAALQYAQAHARAERPWVLVTAEPAPGAPEKFSILATNRGRSPARIVALAEGTAVVKDEANLPAEPAFGESEVRAPLSSMILLPGEFTVIRSFSRDDAHNLCKNPEELHRIESWEERIYLYGNVTYVDLNSPDEKHTFETGWCCWYIHGRQKSGMVSAGPIAYTQHT